MLINSKHDCTMPIHTSLVLKYINNKPSLLGMCWFSFYRIEQQMVRYFYNARVYSNAYANDIRENVLYVQSGSEMDSCVYVNGAKENGTLCK